MDRLHVLAAPSPAPLADAGGRVSFNPAIPSGPVFSFDYGVSFGYRLWWYDVHQVEGAV